MGYRKNFAGIIVMSLFMIALAFGIYFSLFWNRKVEGEARQIEMQIPVDFRNMDYRIEKATREKLQWKKVLAFKGWIFNHNSGSSDRMLYIVFYSKNDTLIFEVDRANIPRKDVTGFFRQTAGADKHGFEVIVPLSKISEKDYRLGFVIEDESGRYFLVIPQALTDIENAAMLRPETVPSEFLSHNVPAVTKNPTRELRFNIDSISISNGYLSLNGWGCLQGMKSGSAKFFILMKYDDTTLTFTGEQMVRKDVTAYFRQSGLNLDSSGFHARISVAGLEKGRYQLGLYLLQGNESGTGYSGKFADINK
ncbi:MAG: hypothetical protein EOM90_14925 [Alphaproteobacteria bacterium]|nr:hypothetical protein [Alphaproteobacteria bacterium]